MHSARREGEQTAGQGWAPAPAASPGSCLRTGFPSLTGSGGAVLVRWDRKRPRFPDSLAGGAGENWPEPGPILSDRLLADEDLCNRRWAEESKGHVNHSRSALRGTDKILVPQSGELSLETVGRQRFLGGGPSGAQTEERCQGRLQPRGNEIAQQMLHSHKVYEGTVRLTGIHHFNHSGLFDA
ncbi:unnamed protein product [Lota lota]